MIRRTTRSSTASATLLGCALAATGGLLSATPVMAAPEHDPVSGQLLSVTAFTNRDVRTPLAILTFLSSWNGAGSVLVITPITILLISLQRCFVQGIAATGIKRYGGTP